MIYTSSIQILPHKRCVIISLYRERSFQHWKIKFISSDANAKLSRNLFSKKRPVFLLFIPDENEVR